MDAGTPSAAQAVRHARIQQIVAGDEHSCVLFIDGAVHCWGEGSAGRLGTAARVSIGDDEPASAGTDVVLGGPAVQLAAGAEHTCALMRDGAVRCWGKGASGRLGYGSTHDIGDDETPAHAGDVALGEPAVQIAAGVDATCAVLSSGTVRCWGEGDYFQLGYGEDASWNGGSWKDDIGDDEVPAAVPPLRLQRKTTQVVLSRGTTVCALLESGDVRCWGATEGNPHDSERKAARDRANVRLGTRAVSLGAGGAFQCAITSAAKLRCWGMTIEFGYGTWVGIGPNRAGWPMPARAGDVRTLSDIVQVVGGDSHICVLRTGGRVRCWGDSRLGQTGRGNGISRVDLDDAMDLQLSAPAREIATGAWHTCALLDDDTVRCWGSGEHGQLGYGTKDTLWDAAKAPPVPL